MRKRSPTCDSPARISPPATHSTQGTFAPSLSAAAEHRERARERTMSQRPARAGDERQRGDRVSGEPDTPDAETSAPYAVILSRQARRNLHENLPLDVAAAAMETIEGPITTNTHRVGKPL